MAHGYLGDGYGTHGDIDSDRDDHREREWRERNWRGHGDEWRDRDRGMMFGDRDRERGRGWSSEDRWNDRGSRDEGYGREHRFGGFQGQEGGFGGSGDYSQGRRSFSAHPDDHYRSWRDRHMGELDRDYQDYCREREQQFHQDFDQWRQQKYGNPQPLRTGMTQSGISHDPSGATQATEDSTAATPVGSDPTATATLGTNSTSGGRRRG